MSKINKSKNRPGCPRCRHSEFTWEPQPFKEHKNPYFTCTSCGNNWASGADGEPWKSSKFCTLKYTIDSWYSFAEWNQLEGTSPKDHWEMV